MAIFALTDAVITINSVDLSDHISQAELQTSAAELDSTAFGDDWMEKIGGLKDWSLNLTFHQDFASSEVDDTVWPLLGTTTAIAIRAKSDNVSTTNPQFSGSVLVNEYAPIAGSVGDLATTGVTWPGSGTLTRNTST